MGCRGVVLTRLWRTGSIEIQVQYPDGAQGNWVAGRSMSDSNRLAPSPSDLFVDELGADGQWVKSWLMTNG